ncbi:unconventional myosin-VIIb [Paramormyrops kingsleyae]|uniref:unconventional myosin-VIIb n=1 Tax=Paramormyrops kingsleyae TaxID=1676925 RepID=UPI000CD65242|nr:unconventional myosin-VIIb-like [Paramormyrops kingsleyae]
MVVLRQGDYVWVDSGIGVPIGAEVKLKDTGQLSLIDDEGKELQLIKENEDIIRPMHPTSVTGVDDMIRLGDFNDAGLLRNLLIRHREGIIYTYSGSILVAVNPYQLLPIYTAEQVELYTDRRLGELPPHVFAIADNCFFNMRRNHKNQCCVISGESGAGKTETTKLMLQFLAAVSGQHSWIEQQILEANPILEAFGNAKTVRNDNSSRFGKYIDISFTKSGAIDGARVEQYLLEKSRVCRQAPEERNYHIFYCMLMGMPAEQKKILQLGNSSEYKYLTMGNCTSCEGRDDIKEYANFSSAMRILMFTENNSWEISKLLAAILHLGNVDFEATILNNLESCDILNSSHFNMAAKLLEVDMKALDCSLTKRSVITNRENVSKPLSSAQAIDGRNAFVKAIYGRLFVWIVEKINSVIYKPPPMDSKVIYQSIGLLDIFGFENFSTNSFEQLCINFANEQLQQFFVKHIFKLEQEDYARENIIWKHIDFSDNQNTLDVLAIKSLNILALIDEESHFPKGTDTTLLNKMNQVHGKSNIYIPPKNNHDMQFGIQHFAGVVHYNSTGLLEKNRDALSLDILLLLDTSSNKLLKQIFAPELATNTTTGSNSKMIITPKNSLRQATDNKKRIPTLCNQFRQSLESLMKTLTACQPFFIRCIKPNDFKKPMLFNRELCMRQLRYSGMMETIRIRKAGYPIRHTFVEFLDRYRVLLRTAKCDPKTESPEKCCQSICLSILGDKDDWQIGKRKIFLKDFHDTVLELERDKAMHEKAITIQRVLRAYKHRKRFVKQRKAAIVLQKHWRGYNGRRLYRKVQLGFARLQATVRSRKLHLLHKQKQAASITLQKHVRGYLARKHWKCKQEAVKVLQAHTRGMLARKAIKKMKKDAFLSAQERRAEELAAIERQKWLEGVLRQKKEASKAESLTDQEMVDNIFGFLPNVVGGQEGQAPVGFEDLESRRAVLEEVDLDDAPMIKDLPEEDYDDLAEYSFSKFASMYFQGSSTSSYVRQRLRQPLLFHDNESDITASLTVWWIILRFMGDLPEPKLKSALPVSRLSVKQNVIPRETRRLSSLVGLDQKILRSKKNRKSSSVPEEVVLGRKASAIPEEARNRKPSLLSEFLTRSRKPSTIPEEVPKGKKLSSIPEAQTQYQNFSLIPEEGIRNRKPSVIPEELEEQEFTKPTMAAVKEEEVVLSEQGTILDRPLTSLEKIHIIVAYAIVRRDLRDEIYCQICKQLTDNGNRNSYFRGWILLSICLGIFPPTECFIKYLQNFIRNGPVGYGQYCADRLRRTMANGLRGEPPSWLELQATKTMKPMAISVTLMDGRTVSLAVDSASTSKEICRTLAQKVKLKDTFGFSLYVALYDKVWSLGSGKEHVMDAISQCEQEVRRQGSQEQHAPWRLYFRKEIFTPWHDSNEDPVSTDLIYRQIIRGLKFGEYQCDKENELVQLGATHFYVQYGSSSSQDSAKNVVQDCINKSLLAAKSEEKWLQIISSAHHEGPYINSQMNPAVAKAEVVDYARFKWPVFFSRFFEVIKSSGPALPKNKFIIAINWTGILFLDEKERKLLQLSYPEVTGVNTMRNGNEFGQSVFLSTLKGDFTLNAVMAVDIAELLYMFLGGLKERSLYAVTLQESTKQDDSTFLNYKKGDLILIIKDEEYSSNHGWIKGKNERTGQTGAVSTDAVLVLPTLKKPTNEVLSLLNLSPDQRKTIIQTAQKDVGTVERAALYSLKDYAFQYFRQPNKDVNQHVLSKGAAPERLWVNSREPIKQPLLKRLAGSPELSHQACMAFTAILKYMGDYPTKQTQNPLELTDQIFGPATKNEALRDEIYCQIMKQMTSNINRFSLERGWQLLWLCCGLFPPSQPLLKHAQRFIESRHREALAQDCLQRVQAALRMEPRKLPPHQVEIDAIQQNSTQIFHKVHFPNDTEEIFEVGSSTRIRDLIQSIAAQLNLLSADGFSIFLKTPDKVLSLNEVDYFFDSLRQITDWSKNSMRTKDGGAINVTYTVFFMRKLWFNVSPGRDLEADLIFHYPQELPKYLRGYHKCTKEDMINMASLLFRAKVNNDISQCATIPKVLKELVPCDQLKAMSSEEWRKSIVASYNKQVGMTVEDAKVAFLKIICRWQTFGCAFFEVKQTSEPSFPDIVQIAISKQGVTIIHPKTKDILATHPFTRIANWCSGSTYFHMTIGNLVKGNKILCETSLGYKMDDLLTSYVNMYVKERKGGRPRNQRIPA